MADADRAIIEEYVLSGNLRESDTKALALSPPRQAELRARLGNLREGGKVAGVLPAPDSDPGDFRAAVQEREEAAALIQQKGKETPRINADKQPQKAIYFANDFVAGLPSPGGLGGLLLFILLFFFILIPATSAGETRTLLLWDVLLGRKQITDPGSTPVVDASSGGIHADVPSVPSIPIPTPGGGTIPWNPITGIIPLDTNVGGGLGV